MRSAGSVYSNDHPVPSVMTAGPAPSETLHNTAADNPENKISIETSEINLAFILFLLNITKYIIRDTS